MRRTLILILTVSILVSLPQARPFNSPVIDGTITGDGTDWDSDDLAVDDPLGDTGWGPNDIDDLWVTYDAENLYVGIRYQVQDNAMLVLIDAGTGTGASDINGLDWYPRNFNFPDPQLVDFIIANWNGSDLGVRRITSNTTTEDITLECQTANQSKANSFYEGEVKIPWNSIYQLGPGLVAAGARIKLVTLIAGGDNWNGPDSAPDNPGMDGSGSPTTLVNFFNILVDGDGDGYPDDLTSFTGAIEGIVEYEDPLDDQTVATIQAFNESTQLPAGETQTAPGGGFYLIDRLADGSYKLEVSARGYGKLTRSNLVISGQDTLFDIDFFMNKTGKITGEVTFRDGPGNTAYVTAYDSITGDIAGDGSIEIPAAGGSYEFLVPDGTYYVTAEAEAYMPDTVFAVIVNSDSVGADTLALYAVRSTKLVLIDDSGEEIPSINTTVSIPDSGIYFHAAAKIEARDDLDRRDYFNLDGYLNHVNLEAFKLNNLSPPRGNVIFYTPDTIPASTITLEQGRGDFLISNDEIEVLRVFTKTKEGGLSGRFKVGIRSTEPEFIELRALDDSITADGEDEVVIEARLLDISLNPVRIPDVPVNFFLAPSSTGKGTFKIPSTLTSADGEVSTSLTATGSGKLHVTASVTYLNKVLTVIGDEENSYVEILSIPGAPAAVRLTSESDIMGLEQSMLLHAQLIDSNGNPVPQEGYTVTFSYTPASAGNLSPMSVVLDAAGQGSATFEAGTERSVVEVSATSTPNLPVEGITFLIDKILLFSDPKAPEPDPGPNSFSAMDLTAVTIGNDPRGLEIKVKFSSNWDGVHLAIVLETENDPDGANGDPFGFPIFYEHLNKPEYSLTYKYATDDYADFRKWDGSQWLWWDNNGESYVTDWVEGVNVRSSWIVKDTAFVEYKIPFTIFEGNIPDSMRVQVYLMQEVDGQKRSAFDSAPSDATLDLDFDPLDPAADWSVTLAPVQLQNYSPAYYVNRIFPNPPMITSPQATPASVEAGETVTFTVFVTSAGDGIGNVLINLSPLGGPRFQSMRDDGTNGDVTPGDGTYSHLFLVDPDVAGSEYELVITAKDEENISRSDTTVTLIVEGSLVAIRSFTDEIDDDHGPNLFGREGLYYLYPTNSVFVSRAFDLEEVTIFETSKVVAGEIIPSLAFQVRMGNFPNPADQGTADWNPQYADINIQKIDVYIDAFKGGATEGLPRRQNDFAKWDAWDYAIVMEGWYKGVIASENQNTPQAWVPLAKKFDKDIILLSDFAQNTITAVVSKEALNNPTNQEILNWDITVLMTSHDGNSDDNNFGDTRWVNANVSEWQPGGGSDSDRDPNIIDLVFSPGFGKKPGDSQSDQLNYKSAEAVNRSEKGKTAVVLAATAFEDLGPPVVDIGDIIAETVPFFPLINAPLYFTASITDDDEVSAAIFRWQPDSTLTGDWMGELPMGYAGNDIWSIDLPVDDITSMVPIAEYDSTRNIEFEIEARDPSGNTTISPLYTMEIPLPTESFEISDLDISAGVDIRAPEGTSIWIPQSAIPQNLLDRPFNFRLRTHFLAEFNFPPHPAKSINVLRTIELEAVLPPPADGSNVYPISDFEDEVEVSFHYPQYSIKGIDENLLAVYYYNTTTNTWIYLGGNVNPFGNLVTVNISKSGTYAIFYNPSVKYDPNEVFSGVVFSPNPFSPNGDGLYEETNISFFLTQEATVTIEIFNIDGERVRILKELFPITAEDTPDKQPRRIAGMTWDGRDNTGKIVPYGIYVTRFSVNFTQAAGQRTIRMNKAVAVIK